MDLIIGLGNPGEKYHHTRHNIGFDIVDQLAIEFGVSFQTSKFKSLIASINHAKGKLVLMKPLTFMNLSGEAVSKFCNFYQSETITPLVVYDDLDLPFGTLKLARKGSSGGHNGIKSLIQHLGTQEFNRLRIGIDKPPHAGMVTNHVLGQFNKEQQAEIPHIINKAYQTIQCYLDQGLDAAMNQFN